MGGEDRAARAVLSILRDRALIGAGWRRGPRPVRSVHPLMLAPMPFFPILALVVVPRVPAAIVPRAIAPATPPHPTEPAENPEQQEEQPDTTKPAAAPAHGLGGKRPGLTVRAETIGDGGHRHERQRGDCPGDPRRATFHSISIVHGLGPFSIRDVDVESLASD